jgi:hemerythrin-like metal-binding protein
VEPGEWEIAWSDIYSVGIPEIDDEHRLFIARVNDVNRAIVELKDKVTVERLMDLMLMEATRHFRNEVKLLEARGFPLYAEHAWKHDQLGEQLNLLIAEFRKDQPSFVWALKGLRIKQLLVEHLLQEDMQFKQYFAR